jgi:hypothetical protein
LQTTNDCRQHFRASHNVNRDRPVAAALSKPSRQCTDVITAGEVRFIHVVDVKCRNVDASPDRTFARCIHAPPAAPVMAVDPGILPPFDCLAPGRRRCELEKKRD